jgi:membrane fusion protein, copper/silver efflux system
VQAILPEVDRETRTIKARVELANPEGALAPGMFVTVSVGADSTEGLFVSTEAVIQTGTRTVVMLVDQNSGFRPVDVELGIESDGRSEIKSGLEAGQRVVVSGQFLVDSEASLTATSMRMADAQSIEHVGEGKIEAVGDETVTLSHTPIPSMQWGSMTMEFRKPADGTSQPIEVGQSVRFAFTIGDDGRPALTRIEPAEGVP